MKKSELRLEILKLRNRNDRTFAQVSPDIEEFEKWILEAKEEIPEMDLGKKSKKSDNQKLPY